MDTLFKALGIKPKNLDLYIEALTHSSYANEHHTTHNERLEFLGDAVLQITLSDYLFKGESGAPGVLTKRRAQIVREEALFIYAEKINLKEHMRLGQGELNKGPNRSMIADAFEAIYGAIYLDLGLDAAKESTKLTIIPFLDEVTMLKDYKSQLQELVQIDRRTLSYHTVKIGGPSNNPEFKAEVYLDENILLGTGIGPTKQDAQQNAAKEALSKVIKEV
ncbi:MAG TPA: ribonuclease III [Acholeplasma sp.]|jgi:ribonuclease-3